MGNGRVGADLGRQMAEAVEDIRAVTIAAVHGWCVGGGLVLAAACDLRIVTDSAQFSIPLVPGFQALDNLRQTTLVLAKGGWKIKSIKITIKIRIRSDHDHW